MDFTLVYQRSEFNRKEDLVSFSGREKKEQQMSLEKSKGVVSWNHTKFAKENCVKFKWELTTESNSVEILLLLPSLYLNKCGLTSLFLMVAKFPIMWNFLNQVFYYDLLDGFQFFSILHSFTMNIIYSSCLILCEFIGLFY